MSYKCPFCPSSDSEELEEFEHKTNNHDIEMVCEDSCKDLSDNKSTDSEINNQSFQSMMSISEVGEIDQNIEEIDHDENENVFENILEDSDSELNEEESKPEINVNYSSEAYGDLMALVTKHKLNNATGNAIIKFFNKHANLDKSLLPRSIEQGRKYMDNMKLPNLNYTKTSIMNYNNNEKLSITWENAEKSLPPGARLLSLILYSDATNVDTLGKSQLHPIYLSIGNIKNWRRNKKDAKQLLAYLPILKSNNITERKSETFKIAVRECFHKSLELLLDPLLKLNKNGIDLFLNNEMIWFYPRVSAIISDWPEAATYCLTYKSPMSKHPCHFCLVIRDNLADLNLQIDDITPRTHVNMQQYFNQNSGNSVCIENISNFFWNLPNINIYQATVPDRMHHLDLGLFHYQIDYTKKLLGAQCGKTLVDEVDHRLAAILRFPSLKIFTNGIQSIARLTANEHRNLMKVMVFVVDNLFVNNEDNENFVKNEDLAKLYETWNEMYAISRYENFKESDLAKFRESINNWSQMFIKILQCMSPSELKLPKLHSWAYHIIDSIRSFGAVNGYTTETYESLHKEYIRRQSITNITHRLPNSATIPHIFKFTAILFEFLLKDAHDFFVEQANIDHKMRSEFDNFLECLNLYMDHESIVNESQVTIYRSVIIENGAIMRATNSYYGRPWYSNVSVRMNSDELFDYASDQGICYGQVLLIAKIELKNQNIPLNLALIQWYDFKFQNQPHLYGCLLLEIMEIYNFIDIEAIQDIFIIFNDSDTNILYNVTDLKYDYYFSFFDKTVHV
ncbi:hypothetical protein GLOIN_2v1762814 [Rhizophagus irregularis DAOM 181602=DAOM 197198]|nr:hypothetical protein GLOIN_2v1762814 [Rhizophagus irregularis DAOM 181602=DAOM 197198]